MAKQIGLHWISLCFLVLGLTQYVICDDSEIVEVQGGDCIFDDDLKDGMTCMMGDEIISIVNSSVPEQSFCSHNSKQLCMTCIDKVFVEMACLDPPRKRIKRGFGRRIGRWFRRSRRSPPPVVDTPPIIKCPVIPKIVTAPPNAVTAVVTWANPTVSDNQGIRSTNLQSGKKSGSSFSEGSNTVTYKVTDTGGQTAICSVTFTVRVIRCPSPPPVSNGGVQCATTLGTVYGTKCTYSCNTGYELSGSTTIQCQQNGAFTASPTCRKISCGPPPVPANSKSVTCTEGNLYQSVCTPECETGYLPGRSAMLVCFENRKWTPTGWSCEDKVKPVFTNCPTKKINTIDKKFSWTLTATDNTGKVTLKQTQGNPPGSPMDYGTHIIEYEASDPTGNKAFCTFVVELKETECPKPTSEDADLRFTCNGMTAQSVCQLSCESGSSIKGSRYIACVRDTTENNTSRWEPLEGVQASCYRRTCPTLNTPKNGALICDKQLGGTVCQIMCNANYDVSKLVSDVTYICGTNEEKWRPRNVAPDCLQLAFPDEYLLPTDLFYYMGDCSDTQAMNNIKQQFINNLNSIGISPCMRDVCSVEEVEVTCGDEYEPSAFDFRRKRSANATSNRVLHVRMKIRVQNSNRTLSPDAAVTLMTSLADKSEEVMSTNTAMREMLYNSLPTVESGDPSAPPPTLPPAVKSIKVTGNLTTQCAAGEVNSESQTGRCVPCSIGTYADVSSGTCKSCPLNTYQNNSASTSCIPCPKHHTTLSTGSVSREDCQKLCGIDHFSPTGRSPCYPCPDEKHQPQIGSKTCLPCPWFHIVGQVSLKCLYRTHKATNDTTIPSEFRVPSYLLTCDKEICLSF